MKIVIIGQGNVGTNLLAAFRRREIEPAFISSRTLEGLPDNADIYIYAVRDTALEEVIDKVHVHARAVHVHTSGTMPLSVFGADKPHSGILYPFQSFSKTAILEDFSEVPVFIEAKNIDETAAIYSLALNLTNRVYEASQHDRERLHVAGVFANNFSNAMYCIAKDLLKGTSIPFAALLPLIDETARKVHNVSPREAQTGPAKRHDEAVMAHQESLISNPDIKELYHLISQQIQKYE